MIQGLAVQSAVDVQKTSVASGARYSPGSKYLAIRCFAENPYYNSNYTSPRHQSIGYMNPPSTNMMVLAFGIAKSLVLVPAF